MIVIRRHINGITLNPYEYILDDNDNPVNFKNKQDSLDFLNKKGDLDVENEEELWETFGIELHKVDKIQLAQLVNEIKNGKNE